MTALEAEKNANEKGIDPRSRSFITFSENDGIVAVHFLDDKVWCEKQAKTVFSVRYDQISQLVYSEKNTGYYHLITKSKVYKFVFPHHLSEGRKLSLLILTLNWPDEDAHKEILSLFSEHKVKTNEEKFSKVFFVVDPAGMKK